MSLPFRVVNTETGKVYEPNESGDIVIRVFDRDFSFYLAPNGDFVLSEQCGELITTEAENGRLRVQHQAGSFKDKDGNQMWEGDVYQWPEGIVTTEAQETVVWHNQWGWCFENSYSHRLLQLCNVPKEEWPDISRVGNTLLKEKP